MAELSKRVEAIIASQRCPQVWLGVAKNHRSRLTVRLCNVRLSEATKDTLRNRTIQWTVTSRGMHMFQELEILELQPIELVEPKRILIVDDDESQRLTLSYRLERLGFETQTVGSGLEGLRLAQHHHPDLVILDVRLPDMDGLSVCERINDNAETCCIPVLILSGMDRQDIVRRARAAGCRYFLRKPYDPNVLLMVIEQLLKGESQVI